MTLTKSERISIGIARAQRRGVRIGRPPQSFDRDAIVSMRSDGKSYRQIAHSLGISVTAAFRTAQRGFCFAPKNREAAGINRKMIDCSCGCGQAFLPLKKGQTLIAGHEQRGVTR